MHQAELFEHLLKIRELRVLTPDLVEIIWGLALLYQRRPCAKSSTGNCRPYCMMSSKFTVAPLCRMASARPDRRPMYTYNNHVHVCPALESRYQRRDYFLEIHAQPVGVNGVATGHASNLMSQSFTLFRQG